MSLTLRTLPSLLTDCVLVGHARKADVVFTPRQFFAICAHMLNENPANFFLMPYRDKEGQPKYAKAFKAEVTKRVPWTWDTITGKAKSPASIAFYPTNAEGKTRWGGMDFDAHDGNHARARELALKAFQVLYRQSQLFVALTTSAGDPEHSGFHLFVFSREFHPREQWTRLFKQVAAEIGAPIEDGVCEIFPNESRGLPKPLRAPGTRNPKTDNCGLVLHETLTQCVSALPSGEDKESIALYLLGEPRGKNYPSSASSEFFRGEHGEWTTIFAITASSTRHQKLTKLVGTAFFQAGREVARKNAELQYREASPAPAAKLTEHLTEFEEAWAGMERRWLSDLSRTEREKFECLTTDNERDAFRILRNWSQTTKPDFKVHCESLGRRLAMSARGAAKLRRKFCELGILWQTAPYIPLKRCARFQWIAALKRRGTKPHSSCRRIGTVIQATRAFKNEKQTPFMKLEPHPFLKDFPMMPSHEIDALAADIKNSVNASR